MREWRGLARSLVIYYANPIKMRRMQALYAQFMRPGDLCFDVGAHVGNRVLAWRRLGASVVAIEPQPACMTFLQHWYGNDPHVMLEPTAVGAAAGEVELMVSTQFPSVTTLSQAWMNQVQQSESFARVRWDARVSVPMCTLDTLIERHGEPAFCKIDVEGFEPEVLAGLSRPLRALSFEYIGAAREAAVACVDRLAQLGEYRYNWSPGEKQQLQQKEWLDYTAMRAFLAGLRAEDGSGDIYARR